MGITLRIPGFNPIHYVASEWPLPEGLAALFLTYGDAVEAVINRVDRDTPGVITGSPTFDADSGTFSQNDWIGTGVGGSTESMALWGIFKRSAAGTHMYMGNFDTGTGDSLLYQHSDTSLRASAAGGGVQAGLDISGVGSDWFFGCAVFGPDSTKVYCGHAGVLTVASSSADRSPLSSADVRVGRGITAQTTNAAEHMVDSIHLNRAPSAADVAELFAWCQDHAEALGVTDLTS